MMLRLVNSSLVFYTKVQNSKHCVTPLELSKSKVLV
jgi:hypothetical protein